MVGQAAAASRADARCASAANAAQHQERAAEPLAGRDGLPKGRQRSVNTPRGRESLGIPPHWGATTMLKRRLLRAQCTGMLKILLVKCMLIHCRISSSGPADPAPFHFRADTA